MKLHSSWRKVATAALVAPLLAVGLAAAPASAAQTPDGELAAAWLTDQLNESGLIVDAAFDFADYGLTIDVFFALDALDVEPEARDAIVAGIEENIASYVTGGTPDDRYAGSLGKAIAMVQAAAGDPTAFGGRDLVADLEARVQDSGRATDQTAWGDFSNMVGQSWVAQSLATASSELADETANYISAQQCDDGGFPVVLDAEVCESDIDATAFAVQALDIAAANEIGNYTGQVDDAVDYLLGQQASSGAWINGDGNPSANSTGVVAAVLDSHGQADAALRAAKWIHGVFVSESAAVGPLAGDAGAIAFDPADLAAAKTNGITDSVRAKWVRAAAQAAPVLDLVDGSDLFTDVPADLTFFPEITWFAGTGITTGYDNGDGTAAFAPSAPVLREQIAAFYYRAAGATYVHEGEPTFTDVSPSHVFYDEIEWFAQQGITTGYAEPGGTTTYRPSQPVLREQVAAFFYRYFDETAVDEDGPSFTDIAASHVFFDEIEWFASSGITTGYDDGTYRGSEPVLREQIAAFFFRSIRT